MAKNGDAHSLRLIEALRGAVKAPAAEAFAKAHPLSRSADVEKKYQWACDVCLVLEAQFGPEEAAVIRRNCHCGDGKTMVQEISGCIGKTGSLADGCRLFSEKNPYAFLEYVSEREVVGRFRLSRLRMQLREACGWRCAGFVVRMLRRVCAGHVPATLWQFHPHRAAGERQGWHGALRIPCPLVTLPRESTERTGDFAGFLLTKRVLSIIV